MRRGMERALRAKDHEWVKQLNAVQEGAATLLDTGLVRIEDIMGRNTSPLYLSEAALSA